MRTIKCRKCGKIVEATIEQAQEAIDRYLSQKNPSIS